MAKLRVTLIHPSAGLNWSGGAEIFSIEMARQLSAHFDVELLSGAPCGSFSRPAGGISRTYTYDFFYNSPISFLWKWATKIPEVWLEYASSFLPCVSHLLRYPPDLIFPANEFGGLAVAAAVRKLTGIPVLYTEHGSLIKNGQYLLRNLRFAPDHLVVFSQDVADFVTKFSPEQKVSIIPNGVDLEKFSPIGEQLQLPVAGPIVLCVASLRKNGHKRIELVLQAMQRLSNASLVLCGDGPDRDYYCALGTELLGSNQFFNISLTYDQMPSLYRSVDVFTLPSINEPFGLAYLEAMACGIPVVATDDSMRRQIIGSGGLVCDVTKLDTYARVLQEALCKPWGSLPREQAARFGWQQIADDYRCLIEQLVLSKRKVPIPELPKTRNKR